MGGGREIPILISIDATVGRGTAITNAKSIVPKSNFFILLPLFLIITLSPLLYKIRCIGNAKL